MKSRTMNKVTKKALVIFLTIAMCVPVVVALVSAKLTTQAENLTEVRSYTVTNVAKGKTGVTLAKIKPGDSEPTWNMYRGVIEGGKSDLTAITDGKFQQEQGCVRIPHGKMAWAVIDLEKNFSITKLGLYFFDNHPFGRVVIQVAKSSDFSDAVTVFNNDTENFVGQGKGQNIAFNNISNGIVDIAVNPVFGRYVRVTNQNIGQWASAHNMGSGFTEIQVFGITEGIAPVTVNCGTEVQLKDFNLELAHEDSVAEIYYTTDGSYPAVGVGTTVKYVSPISIKNNSKTLIRAIAKKGVEWSTAPVEFRYATGKPENEYPPVLKAPWEKCDTITDVMVSSFNNNGVTVDVVFNFDLSQSNGLPSPKDDKYGLTGLQNKAEYNQLIQINGIAIKDILFGSGYGVDIRYQATLSKWVLRMAIPREALSYSIPENNWGGIPANTIAPYINEIVIKEGFPMWEADGTVISSGKVSADEKLAKNTYLYQRWNGEVIDGVWKAKPLFFIGQRESFIKNSVDGSIAGATQSGRLINLYLNGGDGADKGYLFDSDTTYLNHIMRQKPHDVMFMSGSNWVPITDDDNLRLDGTLLTAADYAVESGLRYNIGSKIKINGLSLAQWYNIPVQAALDAGVDPMKLAPNGTDFVGGLGDTHVQKGADIYEGKDKLYIKLPVSGSQMIDGTKVEWEVPDFEKGVQIEILPGFCGANATGKSVKFTNGARAVYTVGLGWTYSNQNDEAGDFVRIQNDAKTQFDGYKDTNNYREAQKTELATAIENGKTAIGNATDVKGVIAALENAKNIMDTIKTDAELTAEEFAAYKMAVRTALDAAVTIADYREAQQTEISNKITALVNEITAAGNDEAKAAIVATFTTWLANVKTEAQLTAEEFAAYKTAVRTALDAAVTLVDYREAQQTEISNKITALVNEIIAAGNDEAKAAIVATFTTWLANVKTEAQLTAEEIKAVAKGVSDKINALPENISLENKAAVINAREAYDGLTAQQKALISSDTLAKLTSAESKIAELEKDSKKGCSSQVAPLPILELLVLALGGIVVLKRKQSSR